MRLDFMDSKSQLIVYSNGMKWQARFFSLPWYRQVSILFFASLAIGAVFVIGLPEHYRPSINADYPTHYKPTAENILHGRGVTGSNGQLQLTYPPGYPVFLAFAYGVAGMLKLPADGTVIAFGLLCGSASAVFVYLTAVLHFGKSIGLLSWFLWATYIPNLATLLHPNSEVPFMLFLFCGIWVLSRGLFGKGGAVTAGSLAGVLLGAAALVRPVALFLPFVLALAVFAFAGLRTRKRIVMSLLLLVGFGISTAPWEIYVKARTQKFIPLCLNGPSSMLDGLEFAIVSGTSGEQANIPDQLRSLMETTRDQRASMKSVGDVGRFVRQQAESNREGLLQLVFFKLVRSWYGMYSQRSETLVLLLQCPYLILMATGYVVVIKRAQRFKSSSLFLSVIPAYFLGMSMLVMPLLRYMVPAIAFLMPFAAIALLTAAAALEARCRLVGLPTFE